MSNVAIDAALSRLDALAGLSGVKAAIHMSKAPEKHMVELIDIESFKWNGKKGKIGF